LKYTMFSVFGIAIALIIVFVIIGSTMSVSKFNPKDFFLWLGAMVALYVSVGSFVTLLFNYIDILFPDKLDVTYFDPYSGPVRFAIASLIVVFPLFLFLTRLVHQEIRKDAEKAKIGIRKWLVYLTIFAAGAFLAGDLIALINTFLNGEITTRFLLKVLVVFVLAGGIFWYYLEEIRGRWEKDEKTSKYIGAGVVIVVVAAIVSGFYLIGTPQDARAERFDRERVSDLEELQWHIVEYYRAKQTLPETLADLEDSIRYAEIPVDPDSGVDYTYRVVEGTTFELCATFTRASDNDASHYTRPVPGPGVKGSDWSHGAGETCFKRTIDPDLYPPLEQKPAFLEVR
jgi:glucose uptake protein GlcU